MSPPRQVGNATEEELRLFATTVENLLGGTQTKTWLAEGVSALVGDELGGSVSLTSISQYLAAEIEPGRRIVWAMERVFTMKPGTLSRLLGYLPVDARSIRTVREAIDADPKLGRRDRETLKAMYQHLAQP